MKIKIRIKTEWDMEYRIWDIDRADKERLKTTACRQGSFQDGGLRIGVGSVFLLHLNLAPGVG
jgi:hypothetical protein